jgi:hypothetical protein
MSPYSAVTKALVSHMATWPWAGTVCSVLLILTACGVRAIFVQMVHGFRRPSAVGTVDFSRLQRQAAGVAKTTLGLRAPVMAF